MALAQTLNELAVANSKGLLNDDEYRLLRQNVFEQQITGTVIPVEVPTIPVASPPTTPRRNLKSPGAPQNPPNSSSRSRPLIITGLTNFFRRATDRKPHVVIEPSTPKRDIPKRRLLPHLPPNKFSFMRTDRNKRTVADSVVSSNTPFTPRLQSPPKSPDRAEFHPNIDIPPSAKDIFDDENLLTAKDISAAIASTQAEATRLLDVFNQVESTTSQRIHLQTALPSATSPRSPNRKHHRRVPGALDFSDGASVDSISSARTSLSRSKSVSSLRSKLHPSSPLSSRHFPPIHSTHSGSSLVSQVPSQGLPAVSSTIINTGNTSRSMLASSEEMQSLDAVGHELVEEASTHTGVYEVQQRRKDVMVRYEARLEYLRARLKGAELHEKLLRK